MRWWSMGLAVAFAVTGCDEGGACGDGSLGGTELCDGDELDGATCASEGLGDGPLRCAAACDAFDVSLCSGPETCGDGALDAPLERCDGADLGGATCASLGLAAGALACAPSCLAFDTSGCGAPPTTCGDGVLSGDEVCDGELFDTTCEAEGFGPGTLACDACAVVLTDGCACLPSTCAALGLDCGVADDGCGGAIDCGPEACPYAYQMCGAVELNVCGAPCELGCPDGAPCAPTGACRIGDGPLVLDVETVPLSGAVTLDGGAPPLPAACDGAGSRLLGRVTLTADDGGTTTLPLTCDGAYAFGPARLVSGTYRATITGFGVTGLPTSAFEIDAVVVDGSPLALDVPTVDAAGVITVDGAPPVERASCVADAVYAVVALQRIGGEAREEVAVRCGSGGAFAFDVGVLLPGVYRVTVRGVGGRAELPSGQTVVDHGLDLSASRVDLALDVVDGGVGVDVTGAITVGGAAPTMAADCPVPGFPFIDPAPESLRVVLDHDVLGEQVAILRCDSADFRYALRVAPGTYRVRVEAAEMPYADGVPARLHYEAGEVTVPAEGLALDVDIPLVRVSGRLTLEGGPPEALCEGTDAVAVVVASPGPTPIDVRCGDDFAWGPLALTAGRYTFDASAFTGRSTLPTGVPSEITIDVSEDRDDVDIDFASAVRVRGLITLDGAPPEVDAMCAPFGTAPSVYVQSAVGGVARSSGRSLGCETDGTYDVAVPRGATVWLGVEGGDSDLPPLHLVAGPIEAPGDVEVSLDVRTAPVTLRLTLDGATPTETGSCVDGAPAIAFVALRELRPEAPFVAPVREIPVPCGASFEVGPVRVPVGVYEVSARGADAGRTNLPTRPFALVDRLEVR